MSQHSSLHILHAVDARGAAPLSSPREGPGGYWRACWGGSCLRYHCQGGGERFCSERTGFLVRWERRESATWCPTFSLEPQSIWYLGETTIFRKKLKKYFWNVVRSSIIISKSLLFLFYSQPDELHPTAGVGRSVPLPGRDGGVREPALREDHPPLHGADCLPSQPLHQESATTEDSPVHCVSGQNIGRNREMLIKILSLLGCATPLALFPRVLAVALHQDDLPSSPLCILTDQDLSPTTAHWEEVPAGPWRDTSLTGAASQEGADHWSKCIPSSHPCTVLHWRGTDNQQRWRDRRIYFT